MALLGKYELHEELGRGGFAVVYRAVDTRLNREVALKVLNASLSEDPRFVAQFRREAQSAANLAHPNIVVIHEADETNGRLFLAMQLLPGLDLRRRIDRDGPLPFPLVVSVIEQIAAALAYAHARGFVHRDVKSANIIVDDSGHATLTDFGLVRAAETSAYAGSLSLTGAVVGTLEYISPEQAKGQPATPRSDLYALGIVAYEMVTGRVPFRADTPLVVIRMQADDLPPDPRELRIDLADGMRMAIMKALAKKPDERQSDVTIFADELRAGWEAETERAVHKADRAQPEQRPAAVEQATAEGAGRWGASKPAGATAGGRDRGWLGLAGVSLGAMVLVMLVVIVGTVILLVNNLSASRNRGATQAALISSLATASAQAGAINTSDQSTQTVPPNISATPGAAPSGTGPEATQTVPSVTAQMSTIAAEAPTFAPVPSVTSTMQPTQPATETEAPLPTAIPNTATPACPPVSGTFAAAWSQVQIRIGCSTGALASGQVVEENFQQGKMLWRQPLDYGQAVVLFGNGAWAIYQHAPFVEGSPDYACVDANTPAQSPPTPRRGFGVMWCDIPAIRSGLGNATDVERGFTGYMQSFSGGFMVGTDYNAVFVFYKTGIWERR